MDLDLYALVSISYPVVILCGTCAVLILSSYVLYSLTSSRPLYTPFLVWHSYSICVVDVRFICSLVRCMSISYPSSWYTNGRPPDTNQCKPHEHRTGNGQVPNKTDCEQTMSGQPPESSLVIVRSQFWTCTKLFNRYTGHQRTLTYM